MAEKCGRGFFVRDVNGANLVRFLYFCRGEDYGSWLSITSMSLPIDHPLFVPNGAMHLWQGVLAYLAKAARLDGKTAYAVAPDSGPYFHLGRIMRLSELAALLGEDPAAVRAELSDLVITVEG